MTLGFTVVETVMLPQGWPVPAGARELHWARFWALKNRRFSFPQGVWGIYMWINVHLGVYVHRCRYSYVCVWEHAWTGGCMCVQMWLRDSKSRFFPMDAGNPVRWQYSVKPLLADLDPEVLGTHAHHFCWEFCASMMPFKMGSVTGLGGPWGCSLPQGCAGLPGLAALSGVSPWEHSSHSWEPLSFLRSRRTKARVSLCIPYTREWREAL